MTNKTNGENVANATNEADPENAPSASDEKFTPLLTTVDWNEEWIQLQKSRKVADSSVYWNERSKTFGHAKNKSTYAQDFLNNVCVGAGDVIFDMGCGNGALAIPMALKGHEVIAADFSSGMLESLENKARECGAISLIHPIQLSWNDPWSTWREAGLTENAVDIAFASRSIATNNLQDSLERLSRVAKKRCCITLSTGASPRIDEQILESLGLQKQLGRDFMYAFNILASLGYHPSVTYLNNARHDIYETREEALESLERMYEDIKRKLHSDDLEGLREKFDAWIGENLCEKSCTDEANVTRSNENNNSEISTYWQLKHPRKTQWALISWDV